MAQGSLIEILQSGALTDGELAAIRDRASSATPGPWKFWLEGRNHEGGSDFIQTADEDVALRGATIADCDFIAAVRQDVPKLVAEIERLQRLVAFLGAGEGETARAVKQ
ncbi:MAG: hypothetical protein AAGE18_04875 [Pseudomonadota bacterium]